MSPARRNVAAWCAGILIAVAAASPPADAVTDRSLAWHMAQHSVLMLVAAPLLVYADLELLLIGRLRGRSRAAVVRLLNSRGVRALGSPVVGWWALALALVGIHMTGLFELAERDARVHAAEHLVLLGTAFLFWRPVLGGERRGKLRRMWRVPYLVLAMPVGDVVAMWLLSGNSPRYSSYAGPGAMSDQRRAAAVMVAGSIVLAAAAVHECWAALIAENRRAERRERVIGEGRVGGGVH